VSFSRHNFDFVMSHPMDSDMPRTLTFSATINGIPENNVHRSAGTIETPQKN
jgi:hypothetical protein